MIGQAGAAAGALDWASFGQSTKLAGAIFNFDVDCADFGPGFGVGQKLAMLASFADGEGEAAVGAKLAARVSARAKRLFTRSAGRGAERTEPRNLAEKLSLDEAKGGSGERIMQGKINDPRRPEDVWAKMQHVHRNPGGSKTVIHYWENLQTGAREGFKFK